MIKTSKFWKLKKWKKRRKRKNKYIVYLRMKVRPKFPLTLKKKKPY